jgi:ABC-type transport system involved in cytochrome bd biosynthesis fused ATPase/permease subunit
MVVLIASVAAMRNSSWFLLESAVAGADETLSANIEVVFVNWMEVHVNPWI